jgi:hypothetical protein
MIVQRKLFRLPVVFLLIGAPFVLVRCSETNFKPPSAAHPSQNAAQKGSAPLRIVYEGQQIHDDHWLRTFSISRLFSHRVKNRSGSFVDIVKPAVDRALYDRGYVIDDTAERILKITLLERNLHWYPPQEFIQTVRPHRRGRYVVELQIQVIYPGHEGWTFNRRLEGEALPGDELRRIESVVDGLLDEFLQGMLDRMPDG